MSGAEACDDDADDDDDVFYVIVDKASRKLDESMECEIAIMSSEDPEPEVEYGMVAKHVAPLEQLTRMEIEEHEVTRYPFKSWCNIRLQGRACATPTKMQYSSDVVVENRTNAVSTVSVDYGCVSEQMEMLDGHYGDSRVEGTPNVFGKATKKYCDCS